MRWGSIQYEPVYDRFHALKDMEEQQALNALGISAIPQIKPEQTFSYVSYDDEKDTETTVEVSTAEFFTRARNESWDLWEAAEHAQHQLFGTRLEWDCNDTGALCFFIWKSGALGDADPDEVFEGFDT